MLFQHLELIDENEYKLSFLDKEQELIPLLVKAANLKPENDCVFTNFFKVEISSDALVVKVIKENPPQEEIDLIEKLATLFKSNVSNVVEFLIDQNNQLNNKEFFQNTKEKHWNYDFLKSYLPKLKSLGLNFDISLVEKLEKFESNFMVIDCQDYLKFIPYDQYSKEKQVSQIVESLAEQTSFPPVKEWLRVHYRRHLLKKEFDSNTIHHILDWMNQLTDFAILQESMSYDRAIAKANQWVEIENQKLGITTLKDEEGIDVKALASFEDYVLYKLISKDSRKREGRKMHNCIGRIHVDSESIFSIRKQGQRIASLDIRGMGIHEAKGPYNEGVEDQHKLGAINCLKSYGIDFTSGSHRVRELENLGMKIIRIESDGHSFEIGAVFNDPLYNISPNNVVKLEQTFSGVDFNNKEKFKESFLEKFSKEVSPKIREVLEITEKQYLICPLTNLMIFQKTPYSINCLNQNAEILSNFPEFKNKWVDAITAFGESHKGFDLVRDTTKGLEALFEKYETVFEGCDQERVRAFLLETTEVYPQFRFHAVFLKPIIGYSENPFKMLEDYTGLSALHDVIEVFQKLRLSTNYKRLQKIEVEFDCPQFKVKKTKDDCSWCNNFMILNEQVEQIEEFNELSEDAERELKQANEALKDIISMYEYVVDFYEEINKLILSQPNIDFIKGKVRKFTVTELRNFIEDLNSFSEKLSSQFNDEKPGRSNYSKNFTYSPEEAVYEYQKSIKELEDFRGKMDSLEYDIRGKDRNDSKECKGCPDCEGQDSECEKCEGEGKPCDIESYIYDNAADTKFDDSKFLKSVEDLSDPSSYYNKNEINLDYLVDAMNQFLKIEKNFREFKNSVFAFFDDFKTE